MMAGMSLSMARSRSLSSPIWAPARTKGTHKFGRMRRIAVLGRGAHAVVFLALAGNSHVAIKEFSAPSKEMSERDVLKKVSAEFCIASALDHINILKTFDLIQTEKKMWCAITEYCPKGDLCHILQMSLSEDDCDDAAFAAPIDANLIFSQLISAVAYLHSIGVAHRDIKPENILFDASNILKLADFGEAEVFQCPFEQSPRLSQKITGSGPYVAPETLSMEAFDARKVDIWACGIVYLVVVNRRLPWLIADENIDLHFQAFLKLKKDGKTLPMIERLSDGPASLLDQIVQPHADSRASMQDILSHPWVVSQLHVDARPRSQHKNAAQLPPSPSVSSLSASTLAFPSEITTPSSKSCLNALDHKIMTDDFCSSARAV